MYPFITRHTERMQTNWLIPQILLLIFIIPSTDRPENKRALVLIRMISEHLNKRMHDTEFEFTCGLSFNTGEQSYLEI
jgi:hypothetical protein